MTVNQLRHEMTAYELVYWKALAVADHDDQVEQE